MVTCRRLSANILHQAAANVQVTASLRTLAARPVMAGSDQGCFSDAPVRIRAWRAPSSYLTRGEPCPFPGTPRCPVVIRDIYPVQWTGRQAVVALPEHIDVSNAGQIREQLLSVINRGATALIADMTATISCDHAGADAVVRAHQRAVISGAELRLVVTEQ